MTLNERINDELEYQGLSRTDLARLSGIGESTIRGWKTTEPKAVMLLAVAKALNVSIEYLLTGADSETEKKSTIKDFVTEEEFEYLIKYRNLPAHDKVMMKKIIDAAYESLVEKNERIVAEGMQA